MEQVVVLDGGIGDFLQCIPFVLNEKKFKYICITHLKGAKSFFEVIGIDLKIYFFSNEKEKSTILKSLPKPMEYLRCPRTQYFEDNPFKVETPLFNNGKPIVGIHVNGSAYSLNVQKQFGMILKSIPSRLIKELISDYYKVMVFGLKEEIMQINLIESDNLRFVINENPAISLAYVQQCNAVVASDSGIKTMSSMLKIPTMVWLGDYQDPPRDQLFIDPYVNDGVMRVFRYKDVNAQFSDGLRLSKEFLKEVL